MDPMTQRILHDLNEKLGDIQAMLEKNNFLTTVKTTSPFIIETPFRPYEDMLVMDPNGAPYRLFRLAWNSKTQSFVAEGK